MRSLKMCFLFGIEKALNEASRSNHGAPGLAGTLLASQEQSSSEKSTTDVLTDKAADFVVDKLGQKGTRKGELMKKGIRRKEIRIHNLIYFC